MKTWSPHFDPFTSENKDRSNKVVSQKTGGKTQVIAHLLRLNNPRFVKVRKPEIEAIKRKSYLIFKFMRCNGRFTKYSKRVKLSEFKSWMGINVTNKIVGFTPDFVGSAPSVPTSKKNYITEATAACFDEIVSNVSTDMEVDLIRSATNPRVVYSSGYDTVHQHLREYLKDNSTESIWTIDKIVEILELSKFSWFIYPKVEFFDVSEIFSLVRVNLAAYAGHYTSMLFGSGKSKSDTASRIVASKIWEALRFRPLKNMYLWTVLGREKDLKVEPNNAKNVEVGTRVVLTTENPMCTLLMWFAQKISFLLNSAKSEERTFTITGEFNADKFKKLHDREKDYDWKLEADWTYYDSNIDTNFLIVAGILMTMGLPDTRLHRNIAYLIIKSIVTKYVLLPPGVVVELNRAQPSGHPFGTLTNCYVNTIYWCLIGYKIYGPRYADFMKIEVYGDDTYALFKDHKNLWNIDKYVSECGLNSESLVGNFESTQVPGDLCNRIDFLKRRFDETGIRWNHKKAFDRFFYQSKNRSLDDQILLLYSFISTGPYDHDMISYSRVVCRYLYDKYRHNVSITVFDLLIELRDGLVKKDERFLYSYDLEQKARNYIKTQKIYDWSISRLKEIVNDEVMIELKLTASQYILLSLAYPVTDIYSYKQKWNLTSGLSPPRFAFKTPSTIISNFWTRTTKEMTKYLDRVARRIKLSPYPIPTIY